MPLMRLALRKYPHMIEAMDTRHLMYNRQLEFVSQTEREGRCLVIRPKQKIPIGHISHDPENMRQVYDMGRDMGKEKLNDIKAFYE